MTYGYGPPPRDWQPADDDPDASRHRRPGDTTPTPAPGPRVPPGSPYSRFSSDQTAARSLGVPPASAPPQQYGQTRRFPQPPPPARHLQAPPPLSAPPTRPAVPQQRRGAGPNNLTQQPTSYPPFPPAVPTSPTVPRVPPPGRPAPVSPGRQAPGGPARQPPSRQPPGAPSRQPPGAPGRQPPGGPGRRGQPAPRRLPPAPGRPRAVRFAEAVPGLIRHLPHHRPWMVALSLIAVAVVFTTCGLGSYLLVRDGSKVVGAGPTATGVVPTRDISSRAVDPALLTVADVFPTDEIMADPTIPPYKRVGNPQVAKDCRVGATADLGKLLNKLGCNQVIRATFRSPDGAYFVTAGIFNLKDNTAAAAAHTDIKELVDESKGRFSGWVSHVSARVLGRAPTNLAWQAQGHFLIYSVIARADAKDFPPDDPHVKVIVYDIVEKYLRDHVIAQWSIDRSTPGPSGPASPTAKPSP